MIPVDLNTPITKVKLDIPMFIRRDLKSWFEKPVRVTEQAFQVLYIYELMPIDIWFGSLSKKELLRTIKNTENEGLMECTDTIHPMLYSIDILTASFDHAAEAFGLCPDWRRDEPRFGAVPRRELCFSLYGVRKLSNNGTTIVVSETPLPIDDPNGSQRLEVSYMQRFWAEKE